MGWAPRGAGRPDFASSGRGRASNHGCSTRPWDLWSGKRPGPGLSAPMRRNTSGLALPGGYAAGPTPRACTSARWTGQRECRRELRALSGLALRHPALPDSVRQRHNRNRPGRLPWTLPAPVRTDFSSGAPRGVRRSNERGKRTGGREWYRSSATEKAFRVPVDPARGPGDDPSLDTAESPSACPSPRKQPDPPGPVAAGDPPWLLPPPGSGVASGAWRLL